MSKTQKRSSRRWAQSRRYRPKPYTTTARVPVLTTKRKAGSA